MQWKTLTRQQVRIIAALGLFILVVVLAGIFWRGQLPGGMSPGAVGPNTTSTAQKPIGYSPAVPKNATLTAPKNEAPASPNTQLGTMARFFDMRMSASGFNPTTLTVNKGDTIHLNLVATDGNYDFDIPYLPFYTSVVNQGQVRQLIFDTATPGTFVFQCRDFCPRSGAIKGSLIVILPQNTK